MPIPGYQLLMLPVLMIASDGEIHAADEAIEALASEFKVTAEERNEPLPSGRGLLFYNRVHWALTYLRQARLLESAGRAKFKITARGQDVLQSKPSVLDRKFLTQFAEFRAFIGGAHKVGVVAGIDGSPPVESHDALSPEERLETTYRELRQEVEAELIDRLRTGSPLFFERAVLSVLLGMGYGGSRVDAARHLGKSGDEGLDGVINEDKLGLDKIYVQAKRYK
ncbi:MAG: restriction endonuclease, partial [Chloroflexi bacterium]|nr:restriction endonuclease [Chloroflexota bacterium]